MASCNLAVKLFIPKVQFSKTESYFAENISLGFGESCDGTTDRKTTFESHHITLTCPTYLESTTLIVQLGFTKRAL